MKVINAMVEITSCWVEVVIIGEQEELFDRYVADPSEENRIDFLNSVDEEIALGIGFGVRHFYEDKDDDD